jgi:hypothetical protein
MKRSSAVMTVVMLVIFVGLVVTAGGYPAGARLMPLIVGIPAIGLCLLQVMLDVRRRADPGIVAAASPEQSVFNPEEAMAPGVRAQREFVLWGYFLAFIGGILLFGFWVAIPVFLVTFLRHQARASWRMALLLTICATTILYVALERTFLIELHRGFVTEYVLDRIGSRP